MKKIIIISLLLLVNSISFSQDSLMVEPVEEQTFVLESTPRGDTCGKTTDVSGVLITSGLTAIGCSGLSWFSSRPTAKVFFIAGGASVVTGLVIRHFHKRRNKD